MAEKLLITAGLAGQGPVATPAQQLPGGHVLCLGERCRKGIQQVLILPRLHLIKGAAEEQVPLIPPEILSHKRRRGRGDGKQGGEPHTQGYRGKPGIEPEAGAPAIARHESNAPANVMLNVLDRPPELRPLPALARQEGTAPEVFGFDKLQPEAPVLPQNTPDPFQHQGHVEAARVKDTYAPKLFGGANVRPLHHVVFLVAILRRPKESRQLLGEVGMDSFR